MGLSLRPASATDYEEIAAWISDAGACLRWAGPKVPYPFLPAELPVLLAVPGGGSYCLADDAGGSPVGFGQYWPRPDGTVHLLRIIIRPESRGQGLGRELCGQLLSRAVKSAPAQAVTLNVYRDNLVAVALYERLGFAIVPEKSKGDALFMLKTVPARQTASG
jgi:ribosomal protein S18 acetylase RimI-like enzyme